MLLRYATLLAALLFVASPAAAQQDSLSTIAKKTDGLEKRDGFFPLYWDASAGKVYLEIERLEEDFLYVVSLPAGLGSNDIGLDRGQLGGEQIVRFERVGPKVLLVAPNVRYRAETQNAAERRAVEDAFAEGVLWGFEAVAATGERVLVDATPFIVRDAHGIRERLKETEQGTFSLDKSRSVPFPENLKAFPQNTEMEARLTFTTDEAGGYVRQVAAAPEAVTLRQRLSFVQLPDTSGFQPRRFDPRSGYFSTEYYDYAAPIGEDLTQRLITRHRLHCAGARDESGLCAPEEPIVYHLDPGTPEPVRSALLDGARWWNAAFEAAGFRDAFRVEMLPEEADPMDVRYNVIQWVHRSTRGWSYGASVTDPRTGEILKGHVTLGSRRVRQDYLLAEGLLAPYTGGNAGGFSSPENDPMLEMALARVRQLSAHEVGHTLGLAHNFAASTNRRASVMDYPAPLAAVENGEVSLQDAYDTEIGEWDRMAIRYGYAAFPDGANEEARLDSIIQEMRAAGLDYLSDADARPGGAAEPSANLWDNGQDVTQALEEEMRVREVALKNFGEAVIREGEPLALMEEALVPLYLRHRYQIDATAKLVGGVRYTYALRGDSISRPAPVEAVAQQRGLDALLATVTPEALRLPPTARAVIPPRPPGYGPNRELFEGYTGLTFDPYAPAEVAAYMTLSAIVQPERAARLATQGDFDASLPSLADVLTRITDQTWKAPAMSDAYDAALQRLVQQVWTDALLEAAARESLSPPVRAGLTHELRSLRDWLGENPGRSGEAEAHRALARAEINRFLGRTYDEAASPQRLDAPPGSPIGGGAPAFQQRQSRRAALLSGWLPAEAACGFVK